jgi:GT2 family glycosyltransferase
MASVSVIVVSWNARDQLGPCLASLTPSAHEVIVVDNASSDGSAEYVASSFPDVTLVRAPVNLGFAGAVNFASRRVAGEFLLVLNPDVLVRPGSIETMAALLESQADCGAVTGRLDDGGRMRPGSNVRRLPTLATFAVDLLLLDKVWPRNPISRRHLALDVDYSQPVDVEQPATACLMLRRSAFEAVGRMDEAFYPAWFEDADLCCRLRHGGWRIVFHPSAVFTRVQPGVAKRHLGHDTFTRIWYRNLQRYARKHHGLTGTAIVKSLIVFGMIERIAISLLRGDPSSAATFRRVLVDVVRPKGYAHLMDQLAGEPQASRPHTVV